MHNIGAIVFTLTNMLNMLISGCKFINNRAPIVMVFVSDSTNIILNFAIESKVFINNNEPIIYKT